MIRRREFIAGLGYAAAWPVVGRAQQAAMPLVGWLGIGSSPNAEAITAVKQGLAETGFIEGRNFAFEYREADYQYDRPPALAADLVRRRVAVIVTGGIEATLAAKAATTTIPIVFATGADPVAGVLSPASIGPARTSLALQPYRPNWDRNDCNCSAS